jgi:hypothetical protein
MTTYKPLQLSSVLHGDLIDLMELMRRLEEYDRNLGAILNRGIITTDNMDLVNVSYTSNGSANTEDEVIHTLGKVPVGFRVINKSKAADVYASGTAWTKTKIYLKTSTTSADLVLEIF